MYVACGHPNVSKVYRDSSTETSVLYPRSQAVDKEDKVDVYLEIPGVEKENIEVNVSNQVLTVVAKKSPVDSNGENEYFNEIAYGEYKRKLKLAHNLDASSIEAKYANGVLKLSIPKKPEAKARNISVS